MGTATTILLLTALAGAAQDSDVPVAEPTTQDLFTSGVAGYHTYRIPALVTTASGALLAFCEGRRTGSADSGDIDLLLRRSTDRGRTWSDVQVLWDDGTNVCGNPCPVVDRESGAITLLMTWSDGDVPESDIAVGHGTDSKRVFLSRSTDDGLTWSEPADITPSVKPVEWSWYVAGPGAGIQMERGEHAGRLVVPCDHKTPGPEGTRFESHVILSDDGGLTWRAGGSAPRDAVNECEVAELEDGSLLLNMRNYDRSVRARQTCTSRDGGESWGDQRHDEALVEPVCQASLRRLRWRAGDAPGVLLFSNPASTEARHRLTVRASYDDCRTWAHSRLLYEGSSAYSCLTALDDGTIGCFFEADDYGRLVFARFGLDWVQAEAEASRRDQ
ncbi:sialidase family protein [Engelhardtia mirabilis]|uniref:exo-alpha-sialidase n=1 Tax=Engelhardtia mirabilis TaxID=2528011 RepID=A0A518BRB2_9BACT|nr:Sialidase precursor [Planctomycetes bacterium Pla133]QDV03816.1 Sialidase precursor [Planctomycetes bacterium Pla86]